MVSTSCLVLVHTTITLPWWGGAGGGVHQSILVVHLSPIAARVSIDISHYRYYRTTL